MTWYCNIPGDELAQWRKERVRKWTSTVGGGEGEEMDEHSGRKKRARRWTSTVEVEEGEEVDKHSGGKKRVRRWMSTWPCFPVPSSQET